MITQEQINRINELAKKAKSDAGLTQAEFDERAELRAAYVAAYKESLVGTLENTYIVDADGNKTKVSKGNK